MSEGTDRALSGSPWCQKQEGARHVTERRPTRRGRIELICINCGALCGVESFVLEGPPLPEGSHWLRRLFLNPPAHDAEWEAEWEGFPEGAD